MSAGVMALLGGLFVLPALLLWAGHHWRKRSARVRGAFWGGVIGHSIAAVVALGAAFYNPAHWSGTDTLRGLLGYWSMPLLGAAGALLGYWLGARGDRA